MSVYQVTGRRAYRGHMPAETFEASLDPDAERRAVTRGDIRLIESSTPSIQPDRYTRPDGWPTSTQEV